MRLAVISDIHGNADALTAVLEDIRGASPDAILNLGDLYSGPLDAARTAEILGATDVAVTIRGNCDRWLVEQTPVEMGPSDRHAHAQLTREMLNGLADLPPTAIFGDVFLCHATPGDDLTRWLEEVTPDGDVRRAPQAHIEALAEGIAYPVILCGHTHIPRAFRLRDGRMIINPGSVGCPGYTGDDPVPFRLCTGAPHASYALLDRRKEAWTVAHRLVPYDTAPAAALSRAAGRPDWAEVLETGWIT